MSTTVIDHGTLRLVTERNVVVAAWRDAPSVAQLNAVERAGRAAGARYASKTALVNLILSGTPNFSSEVRAEVARMNGLTDLFQVGAAHVVLVPGLVGTTVRTFLSTSMLLVKPHAPTRVFGDAEPAARWLSELLRPPGEPWTAAQLTALFARA